MASNSLRLWLAAALLACAGSALPGRIADVRNTPHNLSAAGSATVKATSESQVCVFCHTPHAATQGVVPLWNRQLASQTYTPYTSSSLDANAIQGQLEQPGGSSKLCLSCHDGTIAVGNVNVLDGQPNVSIAMTGTAPGGTMPPGAGTTSGFTRNLGTDLRNDHPISLSYTGALATRDGELRAVDASQRHPPGTGTTIGVRASGYKPLLPLEPTGSGNVGQIQCGTCHDPHIREADATKGNQKFLRMNRFQETNPPTATLDAGVGSTGDIICLGCHDKNLTSGIWAYSAHANPLVATQTYKADAAARRDFPANIPVWKASCLNCHDTHTVQGARRLLREGTDSGATPKAGGNAALEETCYQCHNTAAASILSSTGTVPNIYSDFQLARRMPIRSADQAAGTEMHDISGNFTDAFNNCGGADNTCGADLMESRANLGVGNLANRHAECTDCHNPHRVVKFRSFAGKVSNTGVLTPGLAQTPDPAGTHLHLDAAGYTHTNIISGVLRGAWGVEPIYGSASFQNLPSGYLVKRGDPGTSSDMSVTAPYVTREYQICLKCHSDYGYTDDNLYPSGNTRPPLGGPGLTPSPRTNFTRYTNQAKEFQAPAGHKGQVTTSDSGAGASFQTNNHRSWHPVMDGTGRGTTARGNLAASNWLLPWRNLGTQTMYCSDCHGSAVTSSTSVIPDGGEDGNPWGPHGSNNSFLLKGAWDTASGSGQANALCFKCHSQAIYTGNNTRTGFWIGSGDRGTGQDGHKIHSGSDKMSRIRCNWCHVAVPHGWKNKGLLVNKNDIGPEVGLPPGTAVANSAYTNGPYYRNAMLKIKTFAQSGNWSINSCGATGTDSRDWMRNTCNSPP